jgi:hypothetical protein
VYGARATGPTWAAPTQLSHPCLPIPQAPIYSFGINHTNLLLLTNCTSQLPKSTVASGRGFPTRHPTAAHSSGRPVHDWHDSLSCPNWHPLRWQQLSRISRLPLTTNMQAMSRWTMPRPSPVLGNSRRPSCPLPQRPAQPSMDLPTPLRKRAVMMRRANRFGIPSKQVYVLNYTIYANYSRLS